MVGYKLEGNELETSVFYIQQNYGGFTGNDFRLAYTQFIQGKLEVTVPDFVKINPKSIEYVMQAYRKQEFFRQQKREQPEIYVSEGEKESIISDCICQMFVNRAAGHPVTDFGGAMYKYLIRKNVFSMDEATWAQWMTEARKIYSRESEKDSFKHFMTLRAGSTKNVKQSLIDDITGALVINSFFDLFTDVNHLRNAINP
jgi:hypothetical protein